MRSDRSGSVPAPGLPLAEPPCMVDDTLGGPAPAPSTALRPLHVGMAQVGVGRPRSASGSSRGATLDSRSPDPAEDLWRRCSCHALGCPGGHQLPAVAVRERVAGCRGCLRRPHGNLGSLCPVALRLALSHGVRLAACQGRALRGPGASRPRLFLSVAVRPVSACFTWRPAGALRTAALWRIGLA